MKKVEVTRNSITGKEGSRGNTKAKLREGSGAVDKAAKGLDEMEASLYKAGKVSDGGPTVTMDDLVGCEELHKIVRRDILNSMDLREIFEEAGQTNLRHMLMLYGPCGVGKTYSVKAIRGTLKKHGQSLPIISLSVGCLLEKYVEESEKCVDSFLSMGRKLAPCILVLENVDSAFQESDSSMKKLQTELLNKLQSDKLPDGVILITTTSRPWVIDPTFLCRFTRVYMRLPNPHERYQLACKLLAKCPLASYNPKGGKRLSLEHPATLRMIRDFTNSLINYNIDDVTKLVNVIFREKIDELNYSKCWHKDEKRSKEGEKVPTFHPVSPKEKDKLKCTMYEIMKDSKVSFSGITSKDLSLATKEVRAQYTKNDQGKYDAYHKAMRQNRDPRSMAIFKDI